MGYSYSIAQNGMSQFKNFNDSVFKSEDKILAPKIYFSFSGGGQVLTESLDSVKVICDFLKKNPNLIVEIAVHTDQRGNKDYNLKLSEYRAKSLKRTFIETFKTNPNQIIMKGYGENLPIINQIEIDKVKTDEEKKLLYEQNRRIEIKVIEKQ